jgi:predicted GNAT family acetyltransferase
VPIEIRDNTELRRYEILDGGQVAGFADYRLHDGRLVLPHAEIDSEHGGVGLGSRLARFVLDDARARGLPVVPLCPFIASYIESHPEYLDLVVPAMRARLSGQD